MRDPSVPSASDDAADLMRLPPEVEAQLLACARRTTLAAGESLFREGSVPDALFGVVSGWLRVGIVGPSGREAVVALLEPGHWFGEVSLLIGRERVYNTCAIEASEVAVVAASDFHRLVADRPEVHMAFTRLVCHRLRRALAWIDDAILMPLPARLARRMLGLVEPAPQGALAQLSISQEDLGLMLGVSRQSVNRQLKLWEGQGWLRLLYGRIELLDRAALANTAQATRESEHLA